MENEVREKLRELGRLITGSMETQQHWAGQITTGLAAIHALIETHPDQAAFAQAMRRAWLRLEEPHSNASLGPAMTASIDAALSMIEDAMHDPLLIRSPRGDED